MTPDWVSVRGLFEQAFALAADQRPQFLAEACAGDLALRREVEELLTAAGDAEGLLEPPVAQHLGPDVAAVGSELAGYRLLAVLARGGMGVVYEAEQHEPRRRVALKMLHFGFASGTAARRFRDEADILARLRHPHIAPVFAAGVHVEPDGREHPWFAMEFVEGARNLIDFAEQRSLPTAERLRLFVVVCDAIHHGHQRSVIHRDIKPDNVLVGSDGIPKVIDFGVARTTDADPARRTVAQLESELVGTLQAMSPEQLAGEIADTRADVYGLGVLLYELLTGEQPYELGGLRLPEALRVVRETTPRRPSACARAVTGDLERIVLKAIARDPEQRYASAAALADDLRRFVRHEPIVARPPSLRYQLRLLARRHRAMVAAVTLVFVAAVVAAVISARAAVRARRAESSLREQLELVEAAEREAARQGERAADLFEQLLGLSATMVSDFSARLGSQFGSLELQRDMTRKGVEILESLAARSAGDRRVRAAIARAHLGLGGVSGDQWRRNLGDDDTAAASFRRAHEIASAMVAEQPADRDARLLLAQTEVQLASLSANSGQLDQAIERLQTAIELRRAVGAVSPLSGVERFGIVACHDHLFLLRLQQRDAPAALVELERGRQVLRELTEAEPDVRRWRAELALHQTRQAAATAQSGALADALPLFEESLRMHDELLRDETTADDELRYLRASAQCAYAVALRESARLDDAERQLRSALEEFEAMIAAEPEVPNQRRQRIGCLAELGNVSRDRARAAEGGDQQEQYASARQFYRQALAGRDELAIAGAEPAVQAEFFGAVERSLAECEAALGDR